MNYLQNNPGSLISLEELRQPGLDSEDDDGQEEESLQTDVKSGNIHLNGELETITIIENEKPKTYWVWGRPEMNILPEQPGTQKSLEDKLEPQLIGPHINKYVCVKCVDCDCNV